MLYKVRKLSLWFKAHYSNAANTKIFKVEQPKSKKQKIFHDNDTYLWHLRLGHTNLDRIDRLVKDDPFQRVKS